MADHAIFIGFGTPVRGREEKATGVFMEAAQYYSELQAKGEIEGFEPFFLTPHGGDLTGFFLIRGEREKLDAVKRSEEFQRLIRRAGTIIDHLGVVDALAGAEVQRFVALINQETADLR